MSLRPSGSDALGRRVSAYNQSIYYSKDWQVLQDSNSITIRQYVWSLAYVDAMVLRDFNQDGNMGTGHWGKDGSGLDLRMYPMQDANWNVTGLVYLDGSNARVMQRYVYDPYGKFTCYNENWTPATNPTTPGWAWFYLHQGGRWDTTAGLYHFRNRDYSPTLGRWMTEDPAGYVDGGSLYQAYRSGPVGSVDPMGLNGFDSPNPQRSQRGKMRGLLAKNDDYSSDALFVFIPAQKVRDECLCDEIAFVQYVSENGSSRYQLDQGDPYPHQTTWVRSDPNSVSATMDDTPGAQSAWGYFVLNPFEQRFLSVAKCVKGKEAGKVYGRITWGHKYSGDRVSRWIYNEIQSGDRTDSRVQVTVQ